MAKTGLYQSFYNLLHDAANVFGLGTWLDNIIISVANGGVGKQNWKNDQELYAELIEQIDSKINKMNAINNQQLAKYQSALNDLYTLPVSQSFKSQVNQTKQKLDKKIALANDISNSISSGNDLLKTKASQVLNKTNVDLNTGFGKQVKDEIDDTFNKIQNKIEERSNETRL